MPVIRRYLTVLSAAGLTAAVVLAVAVSDASASPAASSSSRAVTLTSSSSSPTGNLTTRVKFRIEPQGRNKVLSVTVSGSSRVSLKHPALIVSLRPVARLIVHGQVRAFGFVLILRLHSARHFSRALPAKVLTQIDKVFAALNRHRQPITAALLSVTVGSVSRPGTQKPISISAPVGLQVGVLLGPALP